MQQVSQQSTALQNRLANRQSFFGGTVSTRAACIAPTYTPALTKEELAEKAAKEKAASRGQGATTSKSVPKVEEKVVDPKKEFLQKLKKERASYGDLYSSLEDAPAGGIVAPPRQKPATSAGKGGGIIGSSSRDALLSAAARHLASQKSPAGSKGGSGTQSQQDRYRVQNGFRHEGRGPGNPSSSSGSGLKSSNGVPARKPQKVTRVAPSSRGKGAAGLVHAFSPQSKGMSQKQIASAALRDSLDAMRRSNPVKAGTPPIGPSLANRSGPPPGNRGPAPTNQNRQFRLDPGPPRSGAGGAGPSGGGGLARGHGGAGGRGGAPGRESDARANGGIAGGGRHAGLTGVKRKLGGGMHPRNGYSDEESEDEFIVDEDDGAGDWRNALKSITGYDPSRFANERYDDRDMVASFDQIRREEARSLRMGRDEDARAEAELARAAAAKAAAKKKAKKKAKTSVILD